MDILYVLAAVAGVLFLQSFLIRRFAFRGVRYVRSFSKKAAFAGEQVEMVEVLRNAKLMPLPWLRVESRMSTHLWFESRQGEDGALEAAGDALFHRSLFFLAPFSQVTRRHAVRLKRRGYFPVSTVALTAGDLFGLAGATAQMDTGAAMTVYPRLLGHAEMDSPSSRWQGDLAVKRWIAPDPYLVAGIREWRQGDARRDVHWAATARTGRLQVKAHDYTADPKLLVALNVQMQERQWGDLMEYEQNTIEYGISLMATLCVQALESGVEAGIAVNAPSGPDERLETVLLPARYAGREEDILEVLARLRILRTRNFHTFLEELSQLSGHDIILLSAYDSTLIQERVAMLRQKGNSVVLQLLPREERA